jgi:hypothetical protein
MRFRTLDDLVGAGLVEAKPADPARVERWIIRSRADIDLAGRVLAPIDPERAIGVAYEAGYRACAGILVLAGYRVTSQPGHHRATLEGAAAVEGPGLRPLVRRLDAARRFRNDSLYGDPPPVPEDELQQTLADAAEIVGLLEQRLGAR